MLERFRIVRGDTEVYRGKRSAVVRKLATLSRREDISTLKIQRAELPPDGGLGGVPIPAEEWTDAGSGTEFVRGS